MSNSISRLHLGYDPVKTVESLWNRLQQDIASWPSNKSPGPVGVCPGLAIVPGTASSTGMEKDAPVAAVKGDADLKVSQGQITFDAEGNDDPSSPYFSRKISYPGGASGVTLGRGYDMGVKNRDANQIQKDLMASGVDQERAVAFSAGAGLKGAVAGQFVHDNREKLGEISRKEQKKLFERIYPGYVKLARHYYEKWAAGEADSIQWDDLQPAIRDVLADFTYQGVDDLRGMRVAVRAGMRDKTQDLIDYIKSSRELMKYEKARRRIAYLEKHGDK